MRIDEPNFYFHEYYLSIARINSFIYGEDGSDTYSHLLAIGLHHTQAVMTIHLTSLLLSCLAFIAMNHSPFISNMLFIGTVLTGIGLIIYLDDRKRWP